jgi:hypothetical protein
LSVFVGLVVVAAAACAFNYWFVSWLTTMLYRWSVYLGLFFSLWLVVIGVAMIWALHEVSYAGRGGGWTLVLGAFPTGIVFFSGAYAALAFGLDRIGIAQYAAGTAVSFQVLYAHFLWQFVDMIPELDAWTALRVSDPAREAGLWAGLLLVAYRGFVIYILIASVKKAMDAE